MLLLVNAELTRLLNRPVLAKIDWGSRALIGIVSTRLRTQRTPNFRET